VSDEFPLELKQFVAQHIESLAQLETMLLLHRDAERAWTCEELARELYLSADMCQAIVLDLERRRLAARDAEGIRFRYARADAHIDRLVAQLAEVYRDRRVAVITEIYSRPQNKVQTFADAFRIRPEDSP
jgi:hypothetical protein